MMLNECFVFVSLRPGQRMWKDSWVNFHACGYALAKNVERLMGKDGSTVRYVSTIRCASIFAKKYGTLYGTLFL